jgi:hypothetical protein
MKSGMDIKNVVFVILRKPLIICSLVALLQKLYGAWSNLYYYIGVGDGVHFDIKH